MKKAFYPLAKLLIIIAVSASGCSGPDFSIAQNSSKWMDDFDLSDRQLSTTGKNPYFILEPGFQIVLEGTPGKVIMTVENDTREVMGITTRVVEEREWKNDVLYEISRNYFAIDEKTKDVFYFGEEVDMYKGGKVDNHQGAWLAGVDGAKPGLFMPGNLKVDMKFYIELARGVAMDRARVIKLDDKLETPAGVFENCLLTKEGTSLNPIEFEFKTYAPNIGLIQDEKLLLTKYGFMDER